MAPIGGKSRSRSAIAAYACIFVALLLLLGLNIWGSYRDLQFLRATMLQAEIHRLRSHAERIVGRIERDLETSGSMNLADIHEQAWLAPHWRRMTPNEGERLYTAVVDRNGRIVFHSVPSQQGKTLNRKWYKRILSDAGEDVVETHSSALASGELSYDVNVPIQVDSKLLGEYHIGFSAGWFDQWVSTKEGAFLRRSAMFVGAMLLVVILATISLYFIATHSVALRRAVDASTITQATEVSQLAAGLAHEIRNPLHAIQINLHAFRRAHDPDRELSRAEMGSMLDQSTREIERIEALMQQLVKFGASQEVQDTNVDLCSELQNVTEFLDQEMLRCNVQIHTAFPPGPIYVRMDKGRLRQIMLNLLQNGQQIMVAGGRIDIELIRRKKHVEIVVSDNGPGVSESDRRRVFQPFFTTKDDGSGLGLALVKRYVEEAGGKIYCEANSTGGATFRLMFAETRRHASQL